MTNICFRSEGFALESRRREDETIKHEFFVAGTPVAWKRPRRGQGRGKQWRFTDPQVQTWQELVSTQWMVNGRPLFEGPVAVELLFTFVKPPTGKLEIPRQDVDNLAKCVLDALNKLAYADDKQVRTLTIEKRYGTVPGVLIALSQ